MQQNKDLEINSILICGAGNGMHALIPTILDRLDYRLKVYTPFPEEAINLKEKFQNMGGIRLTGIFNSRAYSPELVTTDPVEAAEGIDLLLMVLPAFAHGDVIRNLAPYLKEGIIAGAMPARSGLEYQICSILNEAGLQDFTVFGLQTLPWACRIKEFGTSVEVLGVKESVGLASIPRNRSFSLSGFFSKLLNVSIFPMNNMLELSLANVGQVIHPGIMYGLFRDYSGEEFTDNTIPLFYNGVTEEIADVLADLSSEIINLKKTLQRLLKDDISFDHVLSVKDWLLHSYTDKIENSTSLSTAFQTNQAYSGLKAPVRRLTDNAYVPDFKSRYLTEDIPTGLMVTAGLARIVGLETPVIDQVISAVSRWMGKDYLHQGDLEGSDIEETRIPQNYGIHSTDDLKKLICQ